MAMINDSQKIYEIYKTLEPKPKELLDNPQRKYLKEGPVILWNDRERKRKDRHFFLFNDVLLIAKRLTGNKLKYRLRIYITLRKTVQIVDVPDSLDTREFRIMAPSKTFVLFGRTEAEKKQWMKWIQNTIDGNPLEHVEGGKKSKKDKKKKDESSLQSSSDEDEDADEDQSNSKSDEDVESSGENGEELHSAEQSNSDEDEESSEPKPKVTKKKAKAAKKPLPQVEEASGDAESDSEAEIVNPDKQSFVPVLPDKFFTPSSAKAGTRAGRERKISAALARRRAGSGANSGANSPKLGKVTAPSSSTASSKAAPAKKKQEESLADLLDFGDLNSTTSQPAVAGFGAGAMANNPFGMVTGGSAPVAQTAANPFGGAGGTGGFGMQQKPADPFASLFQSATQPPQQQQQQQQQQHASPFGNSANPFM